MAKSFQRYNRGKGKRAAYRRVPYKRYTYNAKLYKTPTTTRLFNSPGTTPNQFKSISGLTNHRSHVLRHRPI